MRIGLLTTSYPRFEGDVSGCFVEGFARALRDRGHELDVLAPAPREGTRPQPLPPTWVRYMPRPLERTFHGAGVPDNLRLDPLAWPGAFTYPLALLAAARRRAPRWDAIVSHFGLPCGPVGELVANGRPHLCVWHSADVHLQGSLPRWTRRWMRRPGLRHWTVTESARARLGLDERTVVCPMGAEIPTLPDRDEARAALGVEGFVVAVLARLVPIKGIDILIEACAGLDGVTVLVGGDGPDRTRLQRLASRHGVSAEFRGWVVGDEKARLLAAADVIAFPSRETSRGRAEGVPVALQEARLAGAAVIASTTGGLTEGLRPGDQEHQVTADVVAWRRTLARLRDAGPRARRPRPAARWPSLAQTAERALAEGSRGCATSSW